jgi:hypothetical protein
MLVFLMLLMPLASPPAYSPFAVQTEALSISFKDVGLRVAPDQRAAVLEAIAGGVASQLGATPSHRPDWTRKAWHRQCRREHVYVDLWRSPGPDRLGFSLWRGCSADDKVAHVEQPTAPRAFEDAQGLQRATRFGATIGAAIQACTAARSC